MTRQAEIDALTAQVNVSRETIARLEIYENLLKKWNRAINLISRRTISQIWSRHFLDSAQIWALRPKNIEKWLDIGTGGGFPGLVIAILAAEIIPDLSVTLVESDVRKAAFLINTSRELGIAPKIIVARVEKLEPQKADVISARALAPLDVLLGYSDRHKNKNTICLFSKGQNHEIELTEAKKYWKFELQKTPSMTDSAGVILQIGGFGRV